MPTKKIVYIKGALTPNSITNYYGYKFTYDAKLNPVPVNVPEEIANVLLQLKGSISRCCHKTPKNLFAEII